LRREDLIDRVRDGRVVDGHGDLRPEHIYIDGSPKIIDCIEFSSEFRTIDVADELAFLTMECERLDAEWVGQKILEQYCQTSNDRIGQSIVDFFKCYRACVRAKVSALRSQQVSGLEGQELLGNCNTYLRLADRYAEQLGPPALFVVRGLSGTGKSTLAAALSESLGCDYLQTDILRRQLFGTPADSSDFNRGRYTPQNRQQVYDEMFQVAGNYLSHRCSIILDGTFLTARLRQRALQLAREHSAEALLIHCTCPSSVAAERVRERQESSETTSEIRPEFLELQRQQEEPDNEAWPVCTIDTSDGLAPVLRTVYDRLRSLVLAATPQ
jgi:predicted kinase